MSAFRILGLPEGASKDEVKQAYRKLAMLYHPDKNPTPSSHDKFIAITEAYEEIMEGKPRTASTTASYRPRYSPEEERRRDRRARAERYARMKYEQFQAETDAFKESRAYYVVIGGYILLLLAIVAFGLAIMSVPFYLFYQTGSWIAFLISGLVLFAIGGAFLKNAVDIFKQFKPYLREKHSLKPSTRLSYRDVLNLFGIIQRGSGYAPTEVTIYKLLILLPLFYTLTLVIDSLLPLSETREIVVYIETEQEIYYSHRGDEHINLWTTYVTDNFRIWTSSETFNYLSYIHIGDTLDVKYTPLLEYPHSMRPPTFKEHRELERSLHSPFVLIPLFGFGLALFGFLSEHLSDTKIALYISSGISVVVFFFFLYY